MSNRFEIGGIFRKEPTKKARRFNPEAKFLYDTAVNANTTVYESWDTNPGQALRAGCRETAALGLLVEFFPIDEEGVRLESPSENGKREATIVWAHDIVNASHRQLRRSKIDVTRIGEEIAVDTELLGTMRKEYVKKIVAGDDPSDQIIETVLLQEHIEKERLLRESGLYPKD